MRYVWPTIGLVVGLAGAAACISYLCLRPPAAEAAVQEGDTLAWLRREFRLSAEQLARIERMHAEYRVVCDRHCEALLASHDECARLRAGGATAELAAAEANAVRVDAECRAATEAHVRAVAVVMGGDQGNRYLQVVLPKIAGYNHDGAPDLGLNRRATRAHDHGGH